MAKSNTWKDDIRSKLGEIYGEKSTTPKYHDLLGLLLTLDKSDQEHKRSRTYTCFHFFKKSTESNSPLWKTLRSAYSPKGSALLKLYSDRMVKNAGKWEDDQKYLFEVLRIYDEIKGSNGAANNQDAVAPSIASKWYSLTTKTKSELTAEVKKIASNYQQGSAANACMALVPRNAGIVATTDQPAVSITNECWGYLRSWWKGEMDGKMCAMKCVESLLKNGGTVGGVAVGSIVYPGIGSVVGGIIGVGVQALADRLTKFIFDLPNTQAEREAYNFLGVHHTASMEEINAAYKAKTLICHPDKGGNVHDFYQLQHQMGVIMLAREAESK